LTIAKETYFSILVEKKIPPFEVEPDGSACVLDKFISLIRSLRNPCGIKWSSDEEQLASNVGLQSLLSLSCCLRSISESEWSSLKVRIYIGFGTGYSSLCGTGLIADGKSG
jgi:hypothetical protein